jgi:beta-lactam-binding protein with PASTA domain
VTTRSAPLAGPTVVVPRVQPNAGYDPYEQPHRRRAVDAGLAGLWARLNSNPQARIALAAGLVTLGLIAAVSGWWFGIGRYTEAPGLLDRPGPQAAAQAERLGFHVRYGAGRHDEKKAKDIVLQQDPAPGGRVVSGGTITLVLSLGPDRHVIPDVAGKVWDLAVADLKQATLVPERIDSYDDLIPKDSVIRTDPPAGGEVGPNTKISVYVSRGRAPITVPNVVGKRIDEARTALTKLGLQVAVTDKDSDKPAGEVLSQDPIDGAGVEKGTTVNLTVSKGPPEADVPDLRGAPVQQAKQQLEQLGFTVRVFGNGNGRVFIQNPGGGRLPRGSEIQLVGV